MKYLIISDIHGVKEYINITEELIKKESPDKIVLLGDILSNTDEDIYSSEVLNLYKDKIIGIRGNNDYYNADRLLDFKLHDYYIENIKNKNFFFTHGHLLYSYEFNNIDYIAMGHTHRSGISEYNGMKVINPGSIALPRDFHHTYMVISDKIYIKDINGQVYSEEEI